MNKTPTYHITQENALKVIARLEQSGRIVDHDMAWILFVNLFDGKEFQTSGDVSAVCDFYACALWNNGAVLR